MKNNVLKRLVMLCLTLGMFAGLNAQDLSKKIPFDDKVKTGTLENGIKYYIRKNAKPEKRVELRLVVNAGSMQEDEDQQGLAHFTEHMLFNGTKNFEKNDIVKFLQSIGVKFGADLNAYTSFDETVYILPIPTEDPEILEKGFQILEDWAHQATFDNEEIDKERGVVTEEWRTGRGASQRMRDEWFPVLFKGSRYAERLPIGKKDIIQNFKYETIKRFYKDWYRPDLMAVVAVGDIKVEEIEEKIKTHFSKIKSRAEKKREKKVYVIPDHKETLIKVATDKEASSTQILLFYKHDKEKLETVANYRRDLTYQLYNGMLNARLEELSQSPEPPFIYGFSSYGGFIGPRDVYQSFAGVSEDGVRKGLEAILTENQRVLQHGFEETELDRYKKEILNNYEKSYKERKKTASARLVSEYVSHFLDNEPSPGIEWEYETVKELLPTITLAEINQLPQKFITKENRVLIVLGPDKEGVSLPLEAEIRKILDDVDTKELKPYEDKVIDEPLMADIPKGGTVSKEVMDKSTGSTEITLSNGVKVILKPTDFKDDEILMTAYSMGGHSLVKDEDYHSATNADAIVQESGVRKFSSTDLQKLLSGKTASVTPYIGEVSEGMRGNASPKDLETMLQLTHLYFTAPRQDEGSFKSYLTKNKAQFKMMMANPQFAFYDEYFKILNQGNFRGGGIPKEEDFDKIDLDKAMKIYKDRFSDASDFNFFFVGNFEVEKIKPLLETYLGSLPSKNRKETFKDLGIRPPKGIVEKDIQKGTDEKSQVNITFTGEVADTKDKYYIKSLAEVLSIKLIENLREEKGGVYSTRANSSVSTYPYKSYSISVNFSCDPQNVDELVKAVYEEVEKVQKNGPTQEDLDKVKEAQRKDLEKNMKENRYWLNSLRNVYYEDKDIKKFTEANIRKRIDKLKASDLQKTANKYCDMDNRIVLVRNPEPAPVSNNGVEEGAAGAEDKPADQNLLKGLTAEGIIDKYLEAIGGKEKLAKVKSIKREIKMEISGMPIEMKMATQLPDKQMMSQNAMGMEMMKSVINGDKGFVVIQGQKTDMTDEQLKDQSIFIFQEMELAKNGIKTELGKVENVKGKPAVEVKFTSKSGETESKWFDLKSGLVVKTLGKQGEGMIEEYQTVEGIKFPKTINVKTEQQGTVKVTLEKVEVNPTFDADTFKVE